MGGKRFKRNEAFRYDFGKPLDCEYRVIKKEKGIETKSVVIAGKIINISPNGLQLSDGAYTYEIKIGEALEFTFTLTSDLLILVGEVVWKKTEFQGNLYGIRFLSLGMEQVIIDELKKYAKERL
ncbi:PilZ domain-containing protein [Alkalihalobacillus sp. BA299]|uniref:PilZ domain-containing protein n=1 Tax=Alkalihalobacillus sp. BA299 TaxID=2815938 RepID=UPI001ADA9ED0|nr:PilZ domain-containing protein [Alkalihalobacillus sp. BA299]